ncbi:MAG TPA: hypothetical protein PLX06_10615 [Fimbriimonadaceae bacterium]|nr:hypothetical protein [Fimbriimonadaceae bacterium]
MKFPFALALIAASGLAPAQVDNAATDAVKWAFGQLGTQRKLRIRVQGTETIDRSSMTIAGELYFWLDFDAGGIPTAKLEYSEWRDGILVNRTVGDGKALYRYSPQRNEYWVGSYGTHGPTPPARYLPNLMDDFTACLGGSMTYFGRLLRESFVTGGYRAWIPGGQEFLVTKETGPAQDRMWRERRFFGTESVEYAMFWLGTPARRAITFETAIGGETGRTLERIYFTEDSKVGDAPRRVDWIAKIYTNVIPAAENFVFVPPIGAKPIVGPKPNIG